MMMKKKNGDNENQSRNRSTKGRQKIEIKKLEDKNSLQVTFSKRRSGLFSKAMELCVLCGAEVGIVVFSPNGKMYLVGHPNFDIVLNRYLNEVEGSPADDHKEITATSSIPYVQEHSRQYEQALEKLEKERKRSKQIEEEKKGINQSGGYSWLDEPVENMGLEELEEFVKALHTARTTFAMKVNDMVMSKYLAPPPATVLASHDRTYGLFVNNEDTISGTNFDFGQHFS